MKRNNQKKNDFPDKSQTNVIYGISPVIEAISAGNRSIDKILVAEGKQHKRIDEIIKLARLNNIRFQSIPRKALSDFIDENANHQGILAFTAESNYTDADTLISEIIKKENSLCVILDGIEDPHNLGAILRSVECVGADGVFIPERRAVGLTETVAKSSAGASEHVKIARVTNLNRLIDELKKHYVWVIGTSIDAKMNYTKWDYKQKTAIVVGSEAKGISRLTAEKCDVLVNIPMCGKIESLNVSVAAGVVLFEALRQRTQE